MSEMATDLRAAAAQAAIRLAPQPVVDIRVASSGANSVVFEIDCGTVTYALKRYPKRENDPRDRRMVEWRALSFLRARGLTQVPRPIELDSDDRFMLMEWIKGCPVLDYRQVDLDDALSFVTAVIGLSNDPEAGSLAEASEPCCVTQAIIGQIDRRLSGLMDHELIEDFLQADLNPAYERAIQLLPQARLNSELRPSLRRLIPADFGFHNALREMSGRLRYFDFDYFGWDDPAKLVADFVLHPAMVLPDEAIRHVVKKISAATPSDDDFIHRLRDHMPLFAVRWALIVLNSFRMDGKWDAELATHETNIKLQTQLRRAQKVLDQGRMIRAMIGDVN